MVKIYTVTQVSNILNVHFNTVYQLVRSKKLKAMKIGRTIKIREDHLIEFMNKSLIN